MCARVGAAGPQAIWVLSGGPGGVHIRMHGSAGVAAVAAATAAARNTALRRCVEHGGVSVRRCRRGGRRVSSVAGKCPCIVVTAHAHRPRGGFAVSPRDINGAAWAAARVRLRWRVGCGHRPQRRILHNGVQRSTQGAALPPAPPHVNAALHQRRVRPLHRVQLMEVWLVVLRHVEHVAVTVIDESGRLPAARAQPSVRLRSCPRVGELIAAVVGIGAHILVECVAVVVHKVEAAVVVTCCRRGGRVAR